MGKKSKKTEIVLSNSNLTALLSAFEALKTCFGEGLIFYDSTIRQRDKTGLDYEVQTSGRIPARNLDSDEPGVFLAIITLKLEKDSFAGTHSPMGPTQVQIIGSNLILKLLNRKGTRMYVVPEESKLPLENLKEGMRIYYKRNWRTH